MSIKFFEIERKGEVRIKVQAGSRRGYNLGGGSRLKERGRFGLKAVDTFGNYSKYLLA